MAKNQLHYFVLTGGELAPYSRPGPHSHVEPVLGLAQLDQVPTPEEKELTFWHKWLLAAFDESTELSFP